MNTFDVIKGIRLTEAATTNQEQANTYVLEVATQATKDEIRSAVDKVFGKKAISVRTAQYAGKARRKSRKDSGRSAHWKKAFVRLEAGETLDIG
jgi:large subunit ribosomal protein L23